MANFPAEFQPTTGVIGGMADSNHKIRGKGMRFRLFILIVAIQALFVGIVRGASVDLSAISTTDTRSLFVSGKHLHSFYGTSGGKSSQVDIGGKYAHVEGRDPTYSAGIGGSFFFPSGINVDSDLQYYHSHTTFAGGAGAGYKALSLGTGVRVEFTDGGIRETFLRGFAVVRYTRSVGGRELKILLEGEGLGSRDNKRRFDYWTDLRYAIGRHVNIGARLENIRGERTRVAVLGLNY